MSKPPQAYQALRAQHPAIIEAYEKMGAACADAGPLDPKTRALVKLAISIGARLEGAVHAHARKAREAGVPPEHLRHAVLLAMPTIGLPSTVAARTWIEDVLTAGEGGGRKG